MAGDAATNAASRVRPSEEQLNQVDQPAEDNTWHEKPDFSKENLKKQAQGVYSGNPKQDAREAAQAGADASLPAGADLSSPQIDDPRQVDQVAGQNAAKNVVKNKIDQNVDPETKQNILQRNEEYRRRAQEYFNKKMPQERKDQTIWRLKKMILECQQHSDYSQAIQTLLRLAENYGRHGRTVTKGSAGTAQEARGGLKAAEQDLRTLIERFANGTSTEDLWESIGQIYKDADNDPELKKWFKAMDSYIRRCLLEQGYILDDSSSREWDRLYDSGKYLLREKYRGHTDRVIDEVKFLADQFDQDAQNHAFAQSLQKLFHDLGSDDNGKAVFKPHLVKDLTEVIIPAIMENTAYIPIPRIEYSDPQFDAIIENLVLESDNFMPNVAEFASEHYFRWGRKKIANKSNQTIEAKVAGIQMDLRDVSYHVKRKQGFPAITDTGVADILLPGDGFSFKMKVSTAGKSDRQNYFKVEKVDVDVKGLNIKLKQSKHKLLFNLFKPLMLKVLRPALQKAVEKAIKDQCNEFDRFVYQIKQEADKAKDQAKSDPSQAPNIYQRYYEAGQKRIMQGKKKAEDVAADKKVNVAVTKEDSIFPNIHLPGGISSKATEYRDLARKGDRWESPVFSIGSAKKSTDIPAVPKIQRKPHSTRTPNANPLGTGRIQGSQYASQGGQFGQTGQVNPLTQGISSSNPLSQSAQGGLSGRLDDQYGQGDLYENGDAYSNGNAAKSSNGAFPGQHVGGQLPSQNINAH